MMAPPTMHPTMMPTCLDLGHLDLAPELESEPVGDGTASCGSAAQAVMKVKIRATEAASCLIEVAMAVLPSKSLPCWRGWLKA